MNEDNRQYEEADAQALPKLAQALKSLPGEKVFVPPYVDNAVFKAARRHLQITKESRAGTFRRWLFWPAFASAVVLVAFLLSHHQPRYASEDLNHDGHVDILDAFALAREVQRGVTIPAQLDFDGDGVVDRHDTEIIAARAVRIEKGGRS